ncbi:MAG: DUF2269 family protein [Dehalococcoidia bacterium]
MESYRILLSLHLVSVIVGFGVTFTYPFLQGYAERSGVAQTRFALQFIRRLDKMVVYPAIGLVFLFGLGLIFEDQTGYKDDFPVWLMIAIMWYVVMAAVAIFVIGPITVRAIKALDGVADNASFPAAYLAESKKIQPIGGFLGLSIIGIAVLMVLGRTGAF